MRDSPDVYLAREGVGLLRVVVRGKEHIHVQETVHATEEVRDEAGVQTLADAAGAHGDEGAHDALPRSVKHIAEGGRNVKEGGAEELQHPVFVSGHVRIAGGMWTRVVHTVIRVRHHGTEVPSISSNNQHPSAVENPGFLISAVSYHSRKFPRAQNWRAGDSVHCAKHTPHEARHSRQLYHV